MPRTAGPGELPTIKPYRPHPIGGGLLARKCCCAVSGEQATECPPIDSCLQCHEDYDAVLKGIFLHADGGGGRFAFNARLRYDHVSEGWPPEYCRYATNLPLCVVEDLEWEGETEGVSWEFRKPLTPWLYCAVLEHEGELLAWWRAHFEIHVWWHQGQPDQAYGLFMGWVLRPRLTNEQCPALGFYPEYYLHNEELIINPGTFELVWA